MSRSGLLLALLLAGLVASPAQAMKLYRFKVDGRTVLRDSVPPEYAKMGYEVIGSNGMVVEVVPPAPTAEEVAQRKVREQAEAERQKRMADQKDRDVNLLRLYERPADVERARQRKTDEVETYIGLQQRRLDGLRAKLEPLQVQAEGLNNRQVPLPEHLVADMKQFEDAIADTEKDIAERREEISRITRDYAEQHERLRILQVYAPGTLYEEVDFKRVDAESARREAAGR